MKNIFLLSVILFLHGCAIVSVSPAVEGRVTGENGQPVTATVLLRHNQLDDKSTTQTTDENGYYTLRKLRMWTPIPFSAIRLSSTVTISAPGYKTVEFEADSYETVVKDVQLESE